MRLEEIFDLSSTSGKNNSCTSGGCPPDVVVEFRPNKEAYGKFGFDWLKVEDSTLDLDTSDVRYTTNIGNHYKKKIENGKYVLDAGKNFVKDGICSDDTEITTPVGTIFETNEAMQRALVSDFETLTKLTPMNIDDVSSPNVDESLNDIVPALQKTFRYVIPVITLMPKDADDVLQADKKNPYNVNLEAILDVNVYLGSIKPTALRLGFDSTIHETRFIDGIRTEITDETIFNQAFKIDKMNLTKQSKEGHIKITSIGTLHKDITVYVYASTPIGNNHIRGAFKVLRNNVVKDVTVHYMGTIVDAEVNKVGRRLDPKEKQAPTIDMELRSMLGQALINIKQVLTSTPVVLDMTGKLKWETIDVHNPDFNPKKPIHAKKNPVLKPQKGLDADITLSLLELEYYNQYLRKLSSPPKPIVLSATELYSGSNAEYIGKTVYTSEFLAIKDFYPTDIYRCYFFADKGYSRKFQVEAAGGGARGDVRSVFYAENTVVASTLAHELGHNLDLGHTFSQPSAHPYVYQYQSTDNVMDYVDGHTFYYGQWKIMNPQGIS